MEFTHFPKIFTVGQKYITRLFDSPVEITEKVDGSQFCFGKLDGQLRVRSKGQELLSPTHQGMFEAGYRYVESLDLPDDVVFYGEFLQKKRHNNIEYDRVPKNGIALFGVQDLSADGDFVCEHAELAEWADRIGVDVVPLISQGMHEQTDVLDMVERTSFLGGANIEGVVVKNYATPFLLGGMLVPIMMGKYVSEKYKEKAGDWKERHTGKGKWEAYRDSFATEARWQKAVQHLHESGDLEFAPRDIGKLITEVRRDILEECEADIRDWLWRNYKDELLKTAIHGLPEWYKESLVRSEWQQEGG